MDIKARSLTMDEYETYLDKVEEYDKKVDAKEMSRIKYVVNLAKYILTEIYQVEVEKYNPGTIIDLYQKTIKLTEQSEVEDEKN